MHAFKVVPFQAIAVNLVVTCRTTGFGAHILKNYILNKKLLSWPPVGVVFLLFVALFMTSIVSGAVWAQSELAADSSEYPTKPVSSSGTAPLGANVYRPYLVKIVDGDLEIITSTVHRNPSDILKAVGLILYLEDELEIKNNPDLASNPLVGFQLFVDRATLVEFSLRGAPTVAVRTQSHTVADLLSERGVILGATDIVKPALNAKLVPGSPVSVHKVGTKTVTLEKDLAFSRKFIDASSMAYGLQQIKTPGIVGKVRVTYQITYHDSIEVFRVVVRSTTLKEPTEETVVRGVQGAPASKGPLNTAQMQFLGNCESGMNPAINTGNGFYGAFQFKIRTWNAMQTGYSRADLAPLDVQIAAVQKLLTSSSIFSQFPSCANQMVAVGLL